MKRALPLAGLWLLAGCLRIEAPRCGDGIRVGAENCDDGNTFPGDGCDRTCSIELGFLCSDQEGRSQCILPRCGDALLDPGEDCDDGGTRSGDGCDAGCQAEPSCGDGIRQPGEACDDGNTEDGDGCSADCQTEQPAACGDGIQAPKEACDDGNTEDGDGCSAICQIEQPAACGNNILEPGEECDDGNTKNNDGCNQNCIEEVCGDGILQPGEECDEPPTGVNNDPQGACDDLQCTLDFCPFNNIIELNMVSPDEELFLFPVDGALSDMHHPGPNDGCGVSLSQTGPEAVFRFRSQLPFPAEFRIELLRGGFSFNADHRLYFRLDDCAPEDGILICQDVNGPLPPGEVEEDSVFDISPDEDLFLFVDTLEPGSPLDFVLRLTPAN